MKETKRERKDCANPQSMEKASGEYCREVKSLTHDFLSINGAMPDFDWISRIHSALDIE